MQKIRWGVLGTARIATDKVIPAMQRGHHTAVVALASRDATRARRAAERLGIPYSHGSYEELLDDANVDAIYNPLPNNLHVPWSIKALEAGKHVLCEKPIAMSAAEAELLQETTRRHPKQKLMEAFMYRHHPQWQTALSLVQKGGVGSLRTIHTSFSYFNTDAADIRNQREAGGGALLDIGCYPISLSRFLFAAEPLRVMAHIERDPAFGTDKTTSAIMEFGEGTSTFTCSTQLSPYQRVLITGTDGRIEIEIPFNAPPDRACRMWHQYKGTREEIIRAACDQYTIQGDDFALSILNDTPVPTPIEDSIANMQVIDAVFASATSDTWVALRR